MTPTASIPLAAKFLRAIYPQEKWFGSVLIDILTVEGKRKERIRLESADDLEDHEERALATYADQGHRFTFTPAFHAVPEQPRKRETATATAVLWASVPLVTAEELVARANAAPVLPSYAITHGEGGYLIWKLDETYHLDPHDDLFIRAAGRLAKWVGGTNPDPKARLPLPGFNSTVPVDNWRRTTTLDEIQEAPIHPTEVRLDAAYVQQHLINGEALKGCDRPESDKQLVRALLAHHHTEDEIKHLFNAYACGDRAREKGGSYLTTLIDAVQAEMGAKRSLRVYDDGQVVWRDGIERGSGRYTTRCISNFCVHPIRRVLMQESGKELLETEIRWGGGERKTVFLDSGSLLDWRAAVKAFGVNGPSWRGVPEDWQAYHSTIFEATLPLTDATSVVGWHGKVFVIPGQTWFGEGVRYAAAGTIPPKFYLTPHPEPDRFMREVFVQAKAMRAAVNLPLLGWMLAAAHAPRVRAAHMNQFPLMVMEGPGGSGKTTSVQLHLRHIFGIDRGSERSLAGSVAALRRSLQGTNATPVFIDEYAHRKEGLAANDLIRLTYQAEGSPIWDQGNEKANEVACGAPVVITTSFGVEDVPMRERCYIVRVPGLPRREKGQRLPGDEALEWWDRQPVGGLLRWWLDQTPDWIADIPRLRRMVAAKDRQQFAFATVSACLLYCSKRWGWGLTDADCVSLWEENADEEISGDSPLTALDAGIARVIRRGAIHKRQDWWVEGQRLFVVRQNLIDALADGCAGMFVAYTFSRPWIERVLRDAYSAGLVLVGSSPLRVGKAQRRCTVFDLTKMPATAEVVEGR